MFPLFCVEPKEEPVLTKEVSVLNYTIFNEQEESGPMIKFNAHFEILLSLSV